MQGVAVKKIHDRRSQDTLSAGQYVPTEVDDPMGLEAGDKISVLRQTRCDPLGRLHAHRQIDEAQYQGGRAYQQDKETAERGAKAIDPTKEAVDGGSFPEAITDRPIKARKRIIKIEGELGRRLTRVLEAVLIEGKTMEQLAQSRAQSILKLHGNLFRVALNELAQMYGFSNAEKRPEKETVAVQQITS
jgi:hypothetical protein